MSHTRQVIALFYNTFFKIVSVCVCVRTRTARRLLYEVCALSYTAVLSPTVWDATSVCACVYLCARVYVWDIPGLMSSGVINRPVKWPRVLPSALLPLSQTLELVELIASHPWGGLEQFSCVAPRLMTCHPIRMWKSWQAILKGNYRVKIWFIFIKEKLFSPAMPFLSTAIPLVPPQFCLFFFFLSSHPNRGPCDPPGVGSDEAGLDQHAVQTRRLAKPFGSRENWYQHLECRTTAD